MNLHPQIIEKDGKKEFAILPYDEFLAIQEALEDLDDLRALEEAKKESARDPGVAWSSVRDQL